MLKNWFTRNKNTETKQPCSNNPKKANIFSSIGNIGERISSIFSTNKPIDPQSLEDFKNALIEADLGYEVASHLIDTISKKKFNEIITPDIIQDLLKEELLNLLSTYNHSPLSLPENDLGVILFCGINGAGKTTTVGKLATQYVKNGKKVAIAACDTFRAAAESQLSILSERAGCQIFAADREKADPASVAYKAITEAKAKNYDIVMIDTAGRLHTQSNLMEELQKIIRVLSKISPAYPHYNTLVLDGTIGQNSIIQLQEFAKSVEINSLIVTKLDGSSKGGAIIGMIKKFGIPVHYIGLGEKLEDLQSFNLQDFIQSLVSANKE